MSKGFFTKPRLGGLSFGRLIFWLLLAFPGIGMTNAVISGAQTAQEMLHPTGEFAIRAALLAMLVGPLIDIFGSNKFLRWWLSGRRNLGVAAFGFSVLHLIFYVIDKGTLGAIIDEVLLASIWTGWISFFAMMAAAVISADWAVRKMGKRWKQVQMAVYPAYVLGIVHWWLLYDEIGPGMVHLAPLLIVWALRIPVKKRRRARKAA